MKAVRKLVVVISLSMLGLVAVSAASPEQALLKARKDPGVPVPVEVVTPFISADYSGTTVELTFTVDAAGYPANLTVTSAPDERVGSTVADAVRLWKFKPAERNGVPVATKVVLPVKIVDPALPGATFAAR